MSKEKERYELARISMLQSSPFFMSLLSAIPTIWYSKEKWKKLGAISDTMGTDGSKIIICEGFISGINDEQLTGTLAHEAAHIAYGHPYRRKGRNPVLWNIACDLAINPMLEEAGYQLPEGRLLEEEYKGKAAEEIYDLLLKNSQQIEVQCGFIFDPEGDIEEQEELNKIRVAASASYAGKLAGKDSAFANDIIKHYGNATVDWRAKLRDFFTFSAGRSNEVCWSAPNRRHLARGFYLPAPRQRKSLKPVIMSIDCSGSVSPEEQSEYLSEINSILEEFECDVYLVYFDTTVSHIEHFQAEDRPIVLTRKRCGGTEFDDVFRWIHGQSNYLKEKGAVYPPDEYSLCLFFSDGYPWDWPPEEQIPMLWCFTTDVQPPWGEVVRVGHGC